MNPVHERLLVGVTKTLSENQRSREARSRYDRDLRRALFVEDVTEFHGTDGKFHTIRRRKMVSFLATFLVRATLAPVCTIPIERFQFRANERSETFPGILGTPLGPHRLRFQAPAREKLHVSGQPRVHVFIRGVAVGWHVAPAHRNRERKLRFSDGRCLLVGGLDFDTGMRESVK